MALTKRQQITLYQVLGIPFSTKIYRLQDLDNLLALQYQPGALDHVAHYKIQDRLAELESDPDTLADLADCLDRWYCLFGDSTSMDSGGVGSTTGISFDLAEERTHYRERIIAIVPFSRDYMSNELGKISQARLNLRVVR